MTTAHPIASSAEELLAAARQQSGIDIVDTAAIEPLGALVSSYNSDAFFTQEGAREMRRWIITILVNRLRMQRDFAAHPEIAAIPLKAPLIISCIPRTGSTKLQKVLAATGDFNVTPFWMVFNPSSMSGKPNESTEKRIAEADAFVDWMNNVSPAVRAAHEMSTHEPEEDAFIMGQSLCSPWLNAYANCPSYLGWYAKQDHSQQYFYDRDVLKYLIWQGLADVNKPFVLKSAFNSGLEGPMLSAFPDAHVVIPHRHPRESVPSACRLLGEVYRVPFSDRQFDMSKIPSAYARMKKKEMAYRREHPEKPFFDVSFRKLNKDSDAVVRQIYAFAGFTPSASTFDNVAKWEAANPRHKHGANPYSNEEFGFTDQQIDAAFADYIEAYRQFIE